MELVLADGSVRHLSAATNPELLRAARVGVGALGAIAAVTLRCVPAFTLLRVDSPHPRERVLDAFDERADEHRALRALHLPLRRLGAGARAQPHRRAAAATRARRRLPQRRRPRELGPRVAGGNRQGAAEDDPGALAPRRPPRLGQPHQRPQRPRLRQRAAGALHRDGVRGSARARARGGAAGDRVGALERVPGLLPDRDAGRRRRRRLAQSLARTRHRLRRGAPVPGDGVAPLLRGGRGDHGRLRRPPPLGQAPLPDRRDPGAALPGLGGVPARPRYCSTPAAPSPTSTRSAS